MNVMCIILITYKKDDYIKIIGFNISLFVSKTGGSSRLLKKSTHFIGNDKYSEKT